MSYEVQYSAASRADLRLIMDYISHKLMNGKAASDLYDEIQKVIDRLSDAPLMFPLSSNPTLAEASIRRAYIRGYNMYYKFSGQKVYIIRFVSTLRDQDSDNFVGSIMLDP